MVLDPSSIPSSRAFEEPLDPNGRLDYTVDWLDVLDNLTIGTITNTLSTEASNDGLEFVAESNDDTTATVRIGISSGNEGSTAFEGEGKEESFQQTMTDSAGQIWEFSFKITVVQR